MKIYEAHVKGLTKLCPAVPEENRGKFLGLCDPFIINHLKKLGVDAIQLMPVFDSKDTYWGYDPVSWFSHNPKYGTLSEFKTAVKILQKAGIKVILDVVYNHTHNSRPMKEVYYYDWDVTGCGNTVDVKKSLKTIIKSMHYWLDFIGVDGMRFDLANVMGREGGDFNPNAEFFKKVEFLWGKSKIFIAEPWDCAEYSLGRYPSNWLELNGHFRDTVRGGHECRHTKVDWDRSVNFISSHDGFTASDVCSYNFKHNEANGEGNRDGCNNNMSWNHGVEGETRDPCIIRKRLDHLNWLKRQLNESKGHQLILAGDEMYNTQYGNNNAYCQDNDIGWVSWTETRWEELI